MILFLNINMQEKKKRTVFGTELEIEPKPSTERKGQ